LIARSRKIAHAAIELDVSVTVAVKSCCRQHLGDLADGHVGRARIFMGFRTTVLS